MDPYSLACATHHTVCEYLLYGASGAQPNHSVIYDRVANIRISDERASASDKRTGRKIVSAAPRVAYDALPSDSVNRNSAAHTYSRPGLTSITRGIRVGTGRRE